MELKAEQLHSAEKAGKAAELQNGQVQSAFLQTGSCDGFGSHPRYGSGLLGKLDPLPIMAEAF